MKKYYLISSKEDDYSKCNLGVIYEKESSIKNYVYWYEEIPKEDYEVLKKHLENINDMPYEDLGYKTLKDYLEEYFNW